MESKGEIYQGVQKPLSGSHPSDESNDLSGQQVQIQQKVTNDNENAAVNKLFSLGVILLAVSVVITVFYLFSVSQVINNLRIELPGFELPF